MDARVKLADDDVKNFLTDLALTHSYDLRRIVSVGHQATNLHACLRAETAPSALRACRARPDKRRASGRL
jgi:hypothetical protein